jgi:hypothetical protein
MLTLDLLFTAREGLFPSQSACGWQPVCPRGASTQLIDLYFGALNLNICSAFPS